MEHRNVDLPTGMGGLKYGITQISLAVTDLRSTMEQYARTFGWTGWKVYDHRLPLHHDTELRGEPVEYNLLGAEVMVGAVNFELLQPNDGPSLWKEYIGTHGDGIASIAVMFDTVEESEVAKAEFRERGADVTMRARIGDHIEYYYLDTQDRFGCLIESGSGHALDFMTPVEVYPPAGETVEAPREYGITQISLVVRDLETTMAAYHEAFGWGPWKVFQSDGDRIMHHCTMDGEPCDWFRLRWAETQVGDMNFELLQPQGGDSPWQRLLDAHGEGIGSIAVMFKTEQESEDVKSEFAAKGLGVTASGRIGDHIEWYYLDTVPGYKCLIESGSGHALDFMEPDAVYP